VALFKLLFESLLSLAKMDSQVFLEQQNFRALKAAQLTLPL
jgi:hypothetical protein